MKLYKQKLTDLQINDIESSFYKQEELRRKLNSLRLAIFKAEREKNRADALAKELQAQHDQLWQEHKQTYGTAVAKRLDLSDTTVYRRYKQLEQANGRTI